MTLRLNGSSSGFTEIDAPAAAGSNKITLPTSNGSAEQFLKNSGTAGELEFSSMVETSTGVGIGETSPVDLLHAKSASGNANVRLTTGNTSSGFTGLIFGDTDDTNTGAVQYDHSDNSLQFECNNAERMRITSNGNLLVGKTTESNIVTTDGTRINVTGGVFTTRTDNSPILCARQGSDGNLIEFYAQGNTEGSISVSGTTVSYNGGHLARWSQLASGAERTEILRGSVLSNLDEMCEWAYEAQDAVLYSEEDELPEGVSIGDVKTPAVAAGTEDNEQLNRMKVSDVEGDVNVSGVFQAWDDDDDTYTNDFYCAMTGDFVIRIAQGTTVARGDLLMSAGHGTAKPQDNDIVRSKTIAKVTSTTVSTTYSDGSYCVPCVLMAC